GQGLAACWVAAEQRIKVLDYVPRVPKKFPLEKFKRREDLARGPLAAGTPGNLAGWAELVRAHGKKPLGDAFAPAITLARDGFPLLDFAMEEINQHGPAIQRQPGYGAEFTRNYMKGASQVAPGQVLKQPDLAQTFEHIARDGAQYLYGGPLGQAIIRHLGEIGGYMTMADLEEVTPRWKDPLAITYRGRTVHVPPPACEGF